jgi:hypothetical protein
MAMKILYNKLVKGTDGYVIHFEGEKGEAGKTETKEVSKGESVKTKGE